MLKLFRRWMQRDGDGASALPEAAQRPSPASARTGLDGENAAVRLLQDMGWRILARNWRSGHLELDIIAEEDGVLVFVEVKTRARSGLQSPHEALTAVKKERLMRAAQSWLAAHDAWERPCRFDLVCVTAHAGTYQTELIRHVMEFGEQTRHAVGRRNASWQPW